jgi:hypothetical protein
VELIAFQNFTRHSGNFLDRFAYFFLCRQIRTLDAFFDDKSKALFVYATREYLPCLVQPVKVIEILVKQIQVPGISSLGLVPLRSFIVSGLPQIVLSKLCTQAPFDCGRR